MAYGRQLLELRLSRRGVETVVACRPVHHPGRLSLRELQVLAEVTVGATNREIAENLHVSVRTVAAHIEHILTKLDVPNRAAAAGRAATWGLEPARPASPMNGMGARRLCVPQPDPCRIPRDHRVGAGTLRSVDDRPPTIASAGSGGYVRFHRRHLIPGVPHGRRVRPKGVDQLPTPGTGAGRGAASLGDVEVECAVGQ
nr:helix-turn-helix transcriptional regulator [Streptomyces scabichelini]